MSGEEEEEEEGTSVTITTQPRQGPFRIGRWVRFTCSIHPIPPGRLTYRWNLQESGSAAFSYTQRQLSRKYSASHLHYCYYYCEVFADGVMMGSASRIIEVLGELMDHLDVH